MFHDKTPSYPAKSMTQEEILHALIDAYDASCPSTASEEELFAFLHGVAKGLAFVGGSTYCCNSFSSDIADEAWMYIPYVIRMLKARKDEPFKGVAGREKNVGCGLRSPYEPIGYADVEFTTASSRILARET